MKEKEIFRDTYNYFLKYKDISLEDDVCWQKAIEESKVITKKYNSDLCNTMMIAILCRLEQRAKEKDNITLHVI
jgi:hypothetical protein